LEKQQAQMGLAQEIRSTIFSVLFTITSHPGEFVNGPFYNAALAVAEFLQLFLVVLSPEANWLVNKDSM
jgi:hypothetical protein